MASQLFFFIRAPQPKKAAAPSCFARPARRSLRTHPVSKGSAAKKGCCALVLRSPCTALASHSPGFQGLRSHKQGSRAAGRWPSVIGLNAKHDKITNVNNHSYLLQKMKAKAPQNIQ